MLGDRFDAHWPRRAVSLARQAIDQPHGLGLDGINLQCLLGAVAALLGGFHDAVTPIGYRIVEAAEQRGHRTKKTLEIDPIQAETVRLIFRLAREGNGSSGQWASNRLPSISNEFGIRTRDGGRWGVDAVHKVLTRRRMSAGTASTPNIGKHANQSEFEWSRWQSSRSSMLPSSRPCKRSQNDAAPR